MNRLVKLFQFMYNLWIMSNLPRIAYTQRGILKSNAKSFRNGCNPQRKSQLTRGRP